MKEKRGAGEKSRGDGLPAPGSKLLLRWYDSHRRAMPWRALSGETPDPYRVWLSEIMLQQTTVATVGPYFQKFIKRWPTLSDLARASLDDILRLWAGLGYYRRARMLHQCALDIQHKHAGVFPADEKALLALPGFGPYTAAAVAAIAFDQPANVVDGNVERVISRVFAITDPLPAAKTKIRTAAAVLVPVKRPGDYAQALMDLGATLCTPRAPKCMVCPWQSDCQARKAGIQETLPRRAAKAIKPVRRALAFVLLNEQGKLFLRVRPPHGLLGGMLEVPTTPWLPAPMPELDQSRLYAPVQTEWKPVLGQVKHVFTHFILEIAVVTGRLPDREARQPPGNWIDPGDLAQEALPTLMKKIIAHGLARGR